MEDYYNFDEEFNWINSMAAKPATSGLGSVEVDGLQRWG